MSGISSPAFEPRKYTLAPRSNATLAANGNYQLLAAAANTKGAYLRNLSCVSSIAAINTTSPAVVAKATAPASPTDGEVLATPDNILIISTPVTVWLFSREMDIFVPPGLGIFFVAGAAENAALHAALIDVL